MANSDEINEFNKRPIQGAYVGTSGFNSVETQIKTKIDNYLNTSFLARVDSCSTSGTSGSKTVNATPLIADVDGNGNALSSSSLQELAHTRLQHGVAGIVINPVVGDIGIFSCNKADSSNISEGASNSQPPASYRRFNKADAVMVGTVHTKAPTVYIELTQEGVINITAPQGCHVTSDSEVTVTAPTVAITGNVIINGNLTVNGTATSPNGDFTAQGKSLANHVHGNVQNGNSTTSTPQ